MKYLILSLLMISGAAFAQESCQTVSQDVNTPVPLELKDATIIVRTKDGKEREMSENEFKVVKRKQQFKVKERVVAKPVPTQVVQTKYVEVVKKAKEHKNLVMLGGRYDYTHLDASVQGNTVRLNSNKAPIADLTYFRRELFDSRIGAGVSLDTNGTPRALIGLEF